MRIAVLAGNWVEIDNPAEPALVVETESAEAVLSDYPNAAGRSRDAFFLVYVPAMFVQGCYTC